MLQVAFGGYKDSDSVDQFFDEPTYYEPGLNLLFPLEIEAPVINRAYLLIRKRDVNLRIFQEVPRNRISMTAVDATTGRSIPNSVNTNTIYAPWSSNPSITPEGGPLVAFIDSGLDLNNPTSRVRIIDIYIKDTLDNDFIVLRLLVADENKFFHYIPIYRNDMTSRNSVSAAGRDIKVFMRDNTETYIIISPYAWIKESTVDDSDFSYPLDSIYYKRQKTYNEEDFNFSISNSSHSFVNDNISVLTMPNYKKCGILLIDSNIYAKMIEFDSTSFVVIKVEGTLSGLNDTFIINFRRG